MYVCISGVRNISFSENFGYILNEWFQMLQCITKTYKNANREKYTKCKIVAKLGEKSSKENFPFIVALFWASSFGQDTYSNIKSENPVIYKFLWARNNFMCACTSACGLLRRSKWDTSRCEYFFVWNAESKKGESFAKKKELTRKKWTSFGYLWASFGNLKTSRCTEIALFWALTL